MLSDKYREEYLNKFNNKKDKKVTLDKIQEEEQETKTELLHWKDENLADFLRKLDATSPVSLDKKLSTLKNFANYISEKENLEKRDFSTKNINYLNLINKEQLLSVTLSKRQYKEILSKFEDTCEKGTNRRNKLLLELPWEGLTKEEMKDLKESDIEFIEDAIIIHLKDEKIIRIDDKEVIDDIKLCLKERYCIQYTKNGRRREVPYRNSEYLLKPIASGKVSEKDSCLANPQATFRNIFRRQDIRCEGVDMSRLTIRDVRRSKLIYLLSQDGFDKNLISVLFNIQQPFAIKWLQDITEEKYK